MWLWLPPDPEKATSQQSLSAAQRSVRDGPQTLQSVTAVYPLAFLGWGRTARVDTALGQGAASGSHVGMSSSGQWA